jgi:hypothetical protein
VTTRACGRSRAEKIVGSLTRAHARTSSPLVARRADHYDADMGRLSHELALLTKPQSTAERPRAQTLKLGAEPLVPPRQVGRARVAMRPLRRPKRMTTR